MKSTSSKLMHSCLSYMNAVCTTQNIRSLQCLLKARLITFINCGADEKAIFYVITFCPFILARKFGTMIHFTDSAHCHRLLLKQ